MSPARAKVRSAGLLAGGLFGGDGLDHGGEERSLEQSDLSALDSSPFLDFIVARLVAVVR